MRNFLILGACLWTSAIIGLLGCRKAESSTVPPAIKQYDVIVYSGGNVVKTYRATYVEMGWNNNRTVFRDESGKEIRIMGDVIVQER